MDTPVLFFLFPVPTLHRELRLCPFDVHILSCELTYHFCVSDSEMYNIGSVFSSAIPSQQMLQAFVICMNTQKYNIPKIKLNTFNFATASHQASPVHPPLLSNILFGSVEPQVSL